MTEANIDEYAELALEYCDAGAPVVEVACGAGAGAAAAIPASIAGTNMAR